MPDLSVAVPGLNLVQNYLTSDEQVELLEIVDNSPWSTELKRRVQHYGYRYDYKSKTVDESSFLGPLPDWAGRFAMRLYGSGHVDQIPNQLIVNEYLPGQGIAPHIDCVPCFADQVLSLSLASPCVMELRSRDRAVQVPLTLMPGSLLVLSGESRYEWLHGIAPRKSDVIDGKRVPRERRVSLTFRSVIRSHGRA